MLFVTDQVSHPYKVTGKIIVVYILIFKVLFKTGDKKGDSELNGNKQSEDLICS
jgi:hypothetical protein